MRRDKFKLAAWCCGILSAAVSLQSAEAAQPEEPPKPSVKETSQQLEAVIKLLQQGENPTAEATVDSSPQEAKEPDKKTKTASKAKSKTKP